MRCLGKSGLGIAIAACGLVPSSALAGSVRQYTADLRPVGLNNADYDAEDPLPSLHADFTLDTTNANDDFTSGSVSLSYQINGQGFDDLTGLPGAAHLVHFHSQFPSNKGKPIPDQLNGPFFTGDPGNPIPSEPTEESVAGRNVDDNYVDFLEEVPELGPVSFYLGKTNAVPIPEDGEPPLINLIHAVQDGDVSPKSYLPDDSEFHYDHTRTFDLSDQDQRRLILNVIGPDGDELDERVIDAHGFSVPDEVSDAIDETIFGTGDPDRSQDTVNGFPTLLAGVPLGDGTEFRLTGPAVTGGDVRLVPTPTAAMGGFMLLGGLAIKRRNRHSRG